MPRRPRGAAGSVIGAVHALLGGSDGVKLQEGECWSSA